MQIKVQFPLSDRWEANPPKQAALERRIIVANLEKDHIQIFGTNLPAAIAAQPRQQPQHRCWLGAVIALAIMFTLIIATARAAQAQTFQKIRDFTGGQDGANPTSGMIIDGVGNLYGTSSQGGAHGGGAVFKLSYKNSVWVLTPLYEFAGGSDGAVPNGVVFGPDGSLYGTTYTGGTGSCLYGTGCGTVFRLRPPATACRTAICYWTETVLYRFTGGSDGGTPENGNLVFDQSGNLYGTTAFGGTGCIDGTNGCGTVFELMPSGGGWAEEVLYQFTGGSDGQEILAGVTFDKMGNLYGTASDGGNLECGIGYGCGIAFQLTPSGSGWTKNTIYTFQGGTDGYTPQAGLIFDGSGNLYGATRNGGSGFGDGGAVFELAPSDGGWTISALYGLSGPQGGGPVDSLALDTAGNLYGTTYEDGAHFYGNVFKLTRSGGGWTYSSLYDFTGGTDGGVPYCSPVLDSRGNLYGTTYYDGANGEGVVFEIAPQ